MGGDRLEQIINQLTSLEKRTENIEKAHDDIRVALTTLVQHQEKIISLADKTETNSKNIEKIFSLLRENEKTTHTHFDRVYSLIREQGQSLANHIVETHDTNTEIGKRSARWEKLEIGVYTAVIGSIFIGVGTTVATVVWAVISKFWR